MRCLQHGVFFEFLSIIHASYNMIVISSNYNHHTDKQSDHLSKEFMDLFGSTDFSQHVMQPTHNRGPDLVISHGLSTSVSWLYLTTTVCILTSTAIGDLTANWKCYLTSELAANFTEVLPKKVLQLFYQHTVSLSMKNCILKSSLDLVAPLAVKKVKMKNQKIERPCRVAKRIWRKNKLRLIINYSKNN